MSPIPVATVVSDDVGKSYRAPCPRVPSQEVFRIEIVQKLHDKAVADFVEQGARARRIALIKRKGQHILTLNQTRKSDRHRAFDRLILHHAAETDAAVPTGVPSGRTSVIRRRTSSRSSSARQRRRSGISFPRSKKHFSLPSKSAESMTAR